MYHSVFFSIFVDTCNPRHRQPILKHSHGVQKKPCTPYPLSILPSLTHLVSVDLPIVALVSVSNNTIYLFFFFSSHSNVQFLITKFSFTKQWLHNSPTSRFMVICSTSCYWKFRYFPLLFVLISLSYPVPAQKQLVGDSFWWIPVPTCYSRATPAFPPASISPSLSGFMAQLEFCPRNQWHEWLTLSRGN